jgi:acyl carrier protein
MDDSEIDRQFWRLLARVLGRPVAPGRYDTTQLPEWDSLRHVELVFELEETFGVDVPQDTIAALYTDTDTVLHFVREQRAAAR